MPKISGNMDAPTIRPLMYAAEASGGKKDKFLLAVNAMAIPMHSNNAPTEIRAVVLITSISVCIAMVPGGNCCLHKYRLLPVENRK